MTPKNSRLPRSRTALEESDPILRALIALGEEELTGRVVIPFIEAVHPGRIEYTHSPDEAGRDIISFGRDLLGRLHILCVQVKARPISRGARDFGEVREVSTSAKLQGVTREDGNLCIPNEVWYLTSYPFPEWKRRQVSGILQDMTQKNAKFISGEEFSLLIRERIPQVASALVVSTHPHLVDFLSALSKHTDGRAFGLAFDRQIEEFYVTSAISSSVASAKALFNKEIVIDFRDWAEVKYVPLFTLVQIDELELPASKIEDLLVARVPLQATKLDFGGIVPAVTFDVGQILDWVKHAVEKAEAQMHTAAKGDVRVGLNHREKIVEERLVKLRAKIPMTHKVADLFGVLIQRVRSLVEQCPRVLTEGSVVLRDTLEGIRQLDMAVRRAVELGLAPPDLLDDSPSERSEVVRVRIPHPEKLLDLFRILIIDGPRAVGRPRCSRCLPFAWRTLGIRLSTCLVPDSTQLRRSILY